VVPVRCLAIDTSVLLLLIGYKYAETAGLAPPRRVELLYNIWGRNRGLLPPVIFDDLQQMFLHAQARLVTQHIVLESYRRGRELNCFGDKAGFWDAMLKIMNDPGIEETPIEVGRLNGAPPYDKIMKAIGPADAGLIYTAESRKGTVVTGDAHLRHWAEARGAECLAPAQIR
jgi:hypothetical protein